MTLQAYMGRCPRCGQDSISINNAFRDGQILDGHDTQQKDIDDFQSRVQPWLLACFGAEIAKDTVERNHRFLEESIELVQSTGCSRVEAHQLVDYVFDRPVGEPHQEVGGVMVTLAALCLANDLNMHSCGDVELKRIWTKVEQIRAKQAAKPKMSALPIDVNKAEPFMFWEVK